MAARLLARRMHFLAGIVVAPFLVLMCVTGLVYAFSPQIHDDLYHSQLYADEPAGPPRPVSEQVRAALTAHPEGQLRSVITPPEPDRTTRVVLSVPGLDPAEDRTVFVDPYTNYVNGELNTVDDLLPANVWLRQLHSNLHLGEPGRWYAELAATWLPLITVGGLVMWLAQPRRRKRVTWRELLVPAPGGATERWARLRAVHGPLGLWFAAGLLAIGVTGLAMSQYAGGRTDQSANPVHLRAPVLTEPSVQAPPPNVAMPQEPPPALPEIPPPPEIPPSLPEAPPGTTGNAPDPETPPTTTATPPPGTEEPGVPEPPGTTTVPETTTTEVTWPDPPSQPPEETPLVPTIPPLLPSNTADLPAILLASSTPEQAARIGIDRALEVAAAEGLSGGLLVTPPTRDGGVFTVAERSSGLPVQRDSIAIDPYSAQVVERLGWGDYSLAAKLTTLSVEFHTGTLFGLANQILLAVLVIGLLWLIGLGYRMWWVHNPYRGRWASLPPPVWRQLSGPVLVVTLLAVAALSWVLPVLGVSLVVFALLDGAINAVRRRRASGTRT